MRTEAPGRVVSRLSQTVARTGPPGRVVSGLSDAVAVNGDGDGTLVVGGGSGAGDPVAGELGGADGLPPGGFSTSNSIPM